MTYNEIKYAIHVQGRKSTYIQKAGMMSRNDVSLKLQKFVREGLYIPDTNDYRGPHLWIPPHRITKVEYTITTVDT